MKNKGTLIIVAIIAILVFWGCNSYNGLVKLDETVEKSWADVNTEYQRRSDLVGNLVNTVKGAANFEKETLTQVVEARAKATSINLTADELTPENMAKFQQAQTQMTGALSRLLATVEAYPELKANQNFLQLQGQLDGIEGEVRNARRNYNETVRVYNTKVKSFPVNIFAGMVGKSAKEPFKAEEGADKAPKVEF